MNVSNGVKNRAFLFDMDGVLVDSQSMWHRIERECFPALFGKDIADKMPNLVGAGVDGVITLAKSLGAVVDTAEVMRKYDEMALRVYSVSAITPSVEKLADALIERGLRIGLVTQSPTGWIDQIVPRLSFRNSIEVRISIQDTPTLKPKPAPDGYIEACRALGIVPANAIVLEDSNPGIQAGKAAGAFTIGYRGNLVPGYKQTGADAYADTMNDVIHLIETFPFH